MGVLALGAAYWQELAIRYHLHRFSRDEAYLRASLEDPEDSMRGRALQRFIDDPASSEALIRVFILEVSARDVNVAGHLRAGHFDEAMICLGAGRINCWVSWEVPDWARKGSGFGGPFDCSEEVRSRLEVIQGALASRKARSAAVGEYPDAEFSFVPVDQIPSDSFLARRHAEGCAHVCIIRWPKRIAARNAPDRSTEALPAPGSDPVAPKSEASGEK